MAVTRPGVRRQTILIVFGLTLLWLSFYSYFYFSYSEFPRKSSQFRESLMPHQYLRPLANITAGNNIFFHEAIDVASLSNNSRSRKKILDIPFDLSFLSVGSFSPTFDFGPWSRYFLEHKLPLNSSTNSMKIAMDDDKVEVSLLNDSSKYLHHEMIKDKHMKSYQDNNHKLPLNWETFVRLPKTPLEKEPQILFQTPSTLLRNQCPPSVVNALAKRLSSEDVNWCRWALGDGGVEVLY